jgi:hypothetical protein
MSTVQASASSQVVGQAPGMPAVIPRSHFSPASRTPSPHTAGQSASSAAVQPTGQQPSPVVQEAMGDATQAAVQVAGEPRRATAVQDPRDGQAVGQDPLPAAGSQVSTGRSTTPFPQMGAQSGSTSKSAPGGQHPSPATGEITAR